MVAHRKSNRDKGAQAEYLVARPSVGPFVSGPRGNRRRNLYLAKGLSPDRLKAIVRTRSRRNYRPMCLNMCMTRVQKGTELRWRAF